MRISRVMTAIAALAIGAFAVGCGDHKITPLESDANPMAKASRGGMIWADGELFGTVGTPANFSPNAGNFDELYNTGGNGTFADGVAAISESMPGDSDYNGGRWHVNLLNEDVDPDKYADATSVDDLDLDDFHSTDTYFECPLLPRRGNN